MNILLTGASGFIGQHVLHELLAQGHQLTVCSTRQKVLQKHYPTLKYCPLHYARALSVSDWLPHLQGMDAVINAVGIIDEGKAGQFAHLHTTVPLVLFKACEHVQCKRVVQISALGADSSATIPYFVSKGKADAYLQDLDIPWFIIRPSLVFGTSGKTFALLKALAALPLLPLLGDGGQQLQPVYINDLVEAILKCLDKNTQPNQVIHAVGADPQSFAEILKTLRCWLGMASARTISISPVLMRCISPFRKWLQEPALNPDALSMLQQGNTADPEAFTHHLGHPPQRFATVLQDIIATQAERWHAKLYFLRPALRLTLALMWLWAGWVSMFTYPHDMSYQMLAQVGISHTFAPGVLYTASVMDFILGIALLMNWQLRWVIYCQLLVMLIYSVVITLALPEFWAHPFGPMIKNLPIAVATIILFVLEEDSA